MQNDDNHQPPKKGPTEDATPTPADDGQESVDEILERHGVKRVPPEDRVPPGQTEITFVSKVIGYKRKPR